MYAQLQKEGSNKRKLVTAASLYTADKENLSLTDLMSLIDDRDGVFWKNKETKEIVWCTIHEIHSTDIAYKCCTNTYLTLFL